MLEKLNKYKKRNHVFLIIILLFSISQLLLLARELSFERFPLSILMLSILLFILLYSIFIQQKNILKFVVEIINKGEAKNESAGTKDVNIKEEETLTTHHEFDKKLLKGITKKTQKKPLAEKFLSNLIKEIQAEVGLFYTYTKKSKTFQVIASYAYLSDENPPEFKLGEGVNGQVAKNKKSLRINEVPETHLTIVSGLGKGKPKNIIIFPIVFNNAIYGLIEIASFTDYPTNFEEELTKFFEANSDNFLNIDDK